MSDAKTYVGKGKLNKFNNPKVTICLSDIPKEDINEFQGKKYITLVISQMRNPDAKGRTHTVYVDNYKPDTTNRVEIPENNDLDF